jgi:hypothetical protein
MIHPAVLWTILLLLVLACLYAIRRASVAYYSHKKTKSWLILLATLAFFGAALILLNRLG